MSNNHSDLDEALAGNSAALNRVVRALTPIVHARVARVLRCGGRRGSCGRQDLDDITQEVLLVLFASDLRVLRAWEPGRGLSLQNYVGLVAQRRAASILRACRQSTWREYPLLDMENSSGQLGRVEQEGATLSREWLGRLLEQLECTLSPRGYELLVRFFLEQQSVDEVSRALGLSANTLHQWRFRLVKAAQAAAEALEERIGERGVDRAHKAGHRLPRAKMLRHGHCSLSTAAQHPYTRPRQCVIA